VNLSTGCLAARSSQISIQLKRQQTAQIKRAAGVRRIPVVALEVGKTHLWYYITLFQANYFVLTLELEEQFCSLTCKICRFGGGLEVLQLLMSDGRYICFQKLN